MASTYPAWIFDGSPIDDPFGYGERAVRFLRRLKHPSSTAPKNAFQLHDWQERIVRRIYGPRHPDGRRIVETVFWMIPRGNRKTSLAAALALLHTIGPEAVPAGQVIFAASDREQAGLGFKEAANIVRMDKRVVAATRIYDAHNSAKKIVYPKVGAELQAISSDGAAQHGKTPSFVLVDEIHVWKGRDLWEALKSGMVKTSGTLMVIATTAGRGQENIGFSEYDAARRIALGEADNPAYLPIIFEADPADDWQDEAVWHRVNPGLKHGFPNLDKMRSAAKEAVYRPSERFSFKQYNLNEWQAASRDPLFDMTVYDAGRDPNFDLAELEPLPCWLGVDLSRSGDLTAIVGAWRHADGRVSVHPWFYLPSDGLAEKARVEQVPYLRWQNDGFLNVIEGPVIEPDVIAAEIINLCGTYDVQEVAFDPSLAGPIMGKLMDHGVNVVQQPQSSKHMHGPICDLERLVNGKRLRHGGHPILRNHFDSVVVKRATNAGELVTMHKGTRHSNHIDGAVASAIAVSRAAANDNRRSYLDMPPDEFDQLWSDAA
jgi:phage terminase large subunit-like protein